MLPRMQLVGAIRDLIEQLYDADRAAVVKEIMGGVHPDDFTDVPDRTLDQMWRELTAAAQAARGTQ